MKNCTPSRVIWFHSWLVQMCWNWFVPKYDPNFLFFQALPSNFLVTCRHTFENPLLKPQSYHLNFKWNLKLDSVVARFGEYSSSRLYLTTYLTTTISPLWSVSVFREHFLNQSHLWILAVYVCLLNKLIGIVLKRKVDYEGEDVDRKLRSQWLAKNAF